MFIHIYTQRGTTSKNKQISSLRVPISSETDEWMYDMDSGIMVQFLQRHKKIIKTFEARVYHPVRRVTIQCLVYKPLK
jgi:hypothetical protein